MARERYQEFQKIPGAVAKRVGPLVAVTIAPPDPDAAERISAQVQIRQPISTWNERVPVNPGQGLATLILNIFIFAGIVIVLCLGGWNWLWRAFGFWRAKWGGTKTRTR